MAGSPYWGGVERWIIPRHRRKRSWGTNGIRPARWRHPSLPPADRRGTAGCRGLDPGPHIVGLAGVGGWLVVPPLQPPHIAPIGHRGGTGEAYRMGDETRICDICGGEIVFPWKDGRLRPIHLFCSCSRESSGTAAYSREGGVRLQDFLSFFWGYESSLRELAAELGYSLFVEAYCWTCGKRIFLLAKPDGGFAILDDLGPD